MAPTAVWTGDVASDSGEKATAAAARLHVQGIEAKFHSNNSTLELILSYPDRSTDVVEVAESALDRAAGDWRDWLSRTSSRG